jgi:hypothetical protein
VLVTMDRRLEFEHELSILSFGVIVIRARSNRVHDLLPLLAQLRVAIDRSQPGNVHVSVRDMAVWKGSVVALRSNWRVKGRWEDLSRHPWLSRTSRNRSAATRTAVGRRRFAVRIEGLHHVPDIPTIARP